MFTKEDLKRYLPKKEVLKSLFLALKARLTQLGGRSRTHIQQNVPKYIVACLVFLLLVAYFWPSIFITVNAGEAGVLYRRFFGGTVIDRVYGEGFHVVSPWNIMTVYNVRLQTVVHKLDVLTNKGLRISLGLAIRYRPETQVLGVLHQAVGPDYLNKIVIPEIESTLRAILGQYDAEEIYTTKRAIVQQVVNESLEQVSQRFVKIDNVMITEVTLPEKIKKAIEEKLEQQQLAQAYTFKLDRERQEAERKRIEAGGIKDYNSIVESSLSDKVLSWKGVQATLELSQSQNSKVIIIGSGKSGLPVILDTNK